jgi:uncharacterized protein (DUF2252 family)
MTAAAAQPLDRGKAARAATPRSSHADWEPAPERKDPVDILERQAKTRVPELVPMRYGRMLTSPFAFFRGGAAIMAADLAGTPDSGIHAQLCGDAHLSNFGIYAAPDRRMVFDVNDFDETHAGPWEWDVKRFAASLEIAGRDRAFKARRRRAIVLAGVREYREAMRRFATMGNLAVWYARLDVEDFLSAAEREAWVGDVESVRRKVAKARAKDSTRAVAKLTVRENGSLHFVSDPPLVVRLEDLLGNGQAIDVEAWITELLEEYCKTLSPHVRRLVTSYRSVDMARKVVGVGSVGTRAWIVLLEGRDQDDPLVLQAKEAEASVLEEHLGKSPYKQHGERVVQGQRFMQAASDPLLGWQTAAGVDGKRRHFYVRQMWDGKGSAEIETMPADRMETYARMCGWTLARAHARSGDRFAIASYLGSGPVFDNALANFAFLYADQNEIDFAALEQAADDGRVAVTHGL